MYALGGVLHFVLTGRVPFEREGDEAKLWAQLSEPPPSAVAAAARAAAPAFDAVVARAMAKAPDDRYPSAGDLARAARAAAAGRPLPTGGVRAVVRTGVALRGGLDGHGSGDRRQRRARGAVVARWRCWRRRSSPRRRPLIAVVAFDGDAPRAKSATTLGATTVDP